MDDYKDTLRKLAVRDDRYIDALLHADQDNATELDDRSHALVAIGVLVALDAAPAAYMSSVEDALKAGASYEDVVAVLIAALPIAGVARVVSAAPNLGLALGYDVAEALEIA